jgi:flagellar biosynthesis protein FliP
MSNAEGGLTGGVRAAVREERLGAVRTRLWIVVFLFFCVGDLVTTHVGLSMRGVVEAGPVVAPLLREHGLVAMLGLKGATVGVAYGVARLAPDPQSIGVPLGLALVGVLVTGWNLLVLGLSVF